MITAGLVLPVYVIIGFGLIAAYAIYRGLQ